MVRLVLSIKSYSVITEDYTFDFFHRPFPSRPFLLSIERLKHPTLLFSVFTSRQPSKANSLRPSVLNFCFISSWIRGFRPSFHERRDASSSGEKYLWASPRLQVRRARGGFRIPPPPVPLLPCSRPVTCIVPPSPPPHARLTSRRAICFPWRCWRYLRRGRRGGAKRRGGLYLSLTFSMALAKDSGWRHTTLNSPFSPPVVVTSKQCSCLSKRLFCYGNARSNRYSLIESLRSFFPTMPIDGLDMVPTIMPLSSSLLPHSQEVSGTRAQL